MIQKKSEKKLTEEQKRILKQALWDMNLTPEEFLAIIKGKIVTSVLSKSYHAKDVRGF